MAKTNIIVPEGVHTDYTSVIVSYSNGIDSTGALYWALQEFPREKIYLLYCDTGFEYPEKSQAECGRMMGISQSLFSRRLIDARRKMAGA